MNINNFGPKSAIGAKNAQNLQNLQKTDKSGLVGEPQEATAADIPEGETEVDKTVIINWKDGGYEVKYDGINNGVIIELRDGKFESIETNPDFHDQYRDEGEGFHPYPPEE